MNLLYFIRLLLRHALLLIAMPVVLAVSVFFLTENSARMYSSNTRIYTGIATGASIVSMDNSKLDHFATNAAFDNLINIIKLRTTMEEVGMSLLATHLLLEKPVPEIISTKSYENLMEIVPDEVRKLVIHGDFNLTLSNLKQYKSQDHNNFIYELLNFDHPHYSSKEISSKLKAHRVQSSDLIEIVYESVDPGICKSTLDIFCELFIIKYTNLKINQSDAVVNYFQDEMDNAVMKLNVAENELLEFNKLNTIINYQEQTKLIATEKESFNMKHLDLKLTNAGAASALEVLENQMSGRQMQRINNETINSLRIELARVNLEITTKSFGEQTSSKGEETVKEISKLRIKAYELEQELQNTVNKQYDIENSPEGVPTESILEEWVNNIIKLESSKAQLRIAEAQSIEFDKLFESYAPLGATMKRLERRIDVAEREYLSLLHSLGLAKLKQQNVEINSNLEVVAEPFFPLMPNPGKRKYLIILAFMIGFVIPAFVIIVLEFLDANLKTLSRAEDFVGLKVAAVFPNIALLKRRIDLDLIKEKSLGAFARRVILNAQNNKNSNGPDTNIVFSSLEEEGKTTINLLLLDRLSKIGYKVLFLTYNEIEEPEGVDILKYKINNAFHKVEKLSDLDDSFKDLNMNEYDHIFIELPGIQNHSYPIKLFKNIDHSFLVIRANRKWTKADAYSLNDIQEQCNNNKPQILLNGVGLEELENVIGELPTRHLKIRSKSKNNKISKLLLLLLLPIIVVSSILFFIRGNNALAGTDSNSKEVYHTIVPSTVPGKVIEEENIGEDKSIIEMTLSSDLEESQKVVKEKFSLIGGSFSRIENTNSLCDKLREDGFSPTVIKRGNLNSIVIEVFESNAVAQKGLNEYLKIYPKSAAWVLKENKE